MINCGRNCPLFCLLAMKRERWAPLSIGVVYSLWLQEKKDYKKENNLDSKWMTWMTHLEPWDNVKTVHFFTFFATVGNLKSLYWKIKGQKNKQALVVRFIVFAIWEEFLTELGKTPWITGMEGDNNYGDPIFSLKFFQGRIFSCQLHQVWKKLYGTSFQKITFLKSCFGEETIKDLSMYSMYVRKLMEISVENFCVDIGTWRVD